MAMRSLSALILGCALSLPLVPLSAVESPWDDTWRMELKGEERVYADYGGSSYLQVTVDELADIAFLKDKDVLLTAKFAALDQTKVTFYGLDGLTIEGATEAWARALDGDNLYLLGKLTLKKDARVFTVSHVVPAPSDAEVVAERLSKLKPDDLQGRLDVAAWARTTADGQGNKTWWLQASDQIVADTVNAAAEKAQANKDTTLLITAMTWAIENGNRDLAAELGSTPWVLEGDEETATKVATMMESLGYVLHGSGDSQKWMTQATALRNEYDERLEALHWKDADGYFQLGRWADQHADVLPHARELAHTSYLKGQQADPRHPGIRRELGLPPTTEGDGEQVYQLDYDSDGFHLSAPQGWDRTAKPVVSGSDVTWIDPRSDTAFIAAKTVDDSTKPSIDVIWRMQIETLRIRPGFEASPVQIASHGAGEMRRMGYSSRSGDEQRPAELVLIYNKTSGFGMALTVSFVEKEAETARAALNSVVDSTSLPQRMVQAAPMQPPGVSVPTPGQAPGQAPLVPMPNAPQGDAGAAFDP
ncbi:MAG: hypothetical protein PF961_18855 [Planctomycetota bacterium]|jgi:hypothetical protein|nr:hypothetical protein [Planctomycetota bacterium]